MLRMYEIISLVVYPFVTRATPSSETCGAQETLEQMLGCMAGLRLTGDLGEGEGGGDGEDVGGYYD